MTRSRTAAGMVWLGLRQLRSDRMRTLLAVAGVALAVLAVTLLAGVGVGVVETGDQLFNESDRDLWVSGGPIQIAPGTVGGFQNPVPDAHTLSAEIQEHPDVQTAVPMGFQVVYVSPDGEEFDTVMGSGAPGGGGSVAITNGSGFSGADTHYAGGEYDGPMTHEAIISPEIAERYDLEVGDTIYMGGTIANARRNEFEVVGISPTFANFLGTGTVTTRLSELQTLTGNAYQDRATLITIRLEDGADPETVRDELAAAHPEYTFKTNQEQFVDLLERQAVILAGGVSLVVLGVIGGALLAVNLLLSLMYAQRDAFSVLRALGGSRTQIVGVAVTQAIAIAAGGCFVGLVLTPPTAIVLETVAATVTGFEGLVQVPQEAYLGGVAVATVFAIIGSLAGAWRVTRLTAAAELVR
ncbi:hypothetical protein GCM10027435_03040 [Haloparvum alkalitolerans]|uniref:ABC transporter permease n=1 Tax=Haloparvum alkalitolerans TaxID=1042953 RepID=UPI003CEE6F3E